MEGYEDGNGIVSWKVHPCEDTIEKVENAIWRKHDPTTEEETLPSVVHSGEIYAIGEDIFSFRVFKLSDSMTAKEAAEKYKRLEIISFADADWDEKLLPKVDVNMEAVNLVVDMHHPETEVKNPNLEDIDNYIEQYSADGDYSYGFIDKHGHLVPTLDVDDYYETS